MRMFGNSDNSDVKEEITIENSGDRLIIQVLQQLKRTFKSKFKKTNEFIFKRREI